MLKIFIICLCFQNGSTQNFSNVLFEEVMTYHKETQFKADCALEVVSKIYDAFRQWFFTIIFCDFTYFENRILKYTESMDYGYPVLLLNGCSSSNRTKVKPRINRHGETAYVVTSNKLSIDENESTIKLLIRTGVFKPRSVVIFVINVHVDVDSYFYFAMEQHFQLLWSRRITNSVLILYSDRIRVYTYNSFFNKVKDITNIKNMGKLLSRQYDNLYGRTLRLSVFRKIYLSDKTGPVKCDSLLTQTVMKFMNATCLPLTPRDGSTVGDLLENGTATGVTGDLIDGYTDLELNSRILKPTYYGYIDTTYPLAQDELCFMVKSSEKQSAFTTTINLISRDILILFTFTVIMFISVGLLSRKTEVIVLKIRENQSMSSVTMDLLKCLLRQTVDITFLGPVFRMVVLIIILYSLVINCVIDGVITSAITYPRQKPNINSGEELIDKTNLTFGVHNRHMTIFNNTLSPPNYLKLQNRIEILRDKNFKQIIEERQYQYAILLRKTDALYISRKPRNMKDGRSLYHIVKDCPVPCSIVYGLQYGSPYLNRINYILHHLNQAGILNHWEESDEYTLYKNRDHEFYNNENKEKTPLGLDHFWEVFVVWGVCISMCTIAFVLELFRYGRVLYLGIQMVI